MVESWATTIENVIRFSLQLEAEYVQRGISHGAKRPFFLRLIFGGKSVWAVGDSVA
jgi:hypothetical protein